jgi:hypothetical protein
MYTWLHLLLQIVIVPKQFWGTYAHTHTLRSSRNLIAPFASGWSRHQRSWRNHPLCLVWAGPGPFTPRSFQVFRLTEHWGSSIQRSLLAIPAQRSFSGTSAHLAFRHFLLRERFMHFLLKGFFTGTSAQFAVSDTALKEILDGLWVRSAVFDTLRWGKLYSWKVHF